ncbi:MAG: right-handed parallel beta-helix repeat-containing protein, partial [Phycisphaerae bacterium]|nr:right-handed parallel beta-helix repeat-containing protein [Phycisphaerae bacterium]
MKTSNQRFWGTLVLASAAMLVCSAAVAETYYVSLKGDDANKGMTEKAAFRTIKKGVSVLKAGDTLIIKSGDYGDDPAVVSSSGTKDAPITIKAEVPGKVVVKGTGQGAGISIKNKSYIIVEGIEFTNFATGITISRASSCITVRKCIFRNNRGRGLILYGNKRRPTDSHHHLFTENQFLDLTPPYKGLTPGSDVRDTQDYGLQLYFSTNVEVVNNYFHGHHHQCLSFKKIMKDSRAAGNIFEGFQLSAIVLGQNTDSKAEGDLRCYNLVAEGNTFRPAPGY